MHADVGAALPHDQAFDEALAARTGLAGAAKNFEEGSVASGFALKGVEVGLTAAKGGS